MSDAHDEKSDAPAVGGSKPTEDHRSQVARERRARTRHQILKSLMTIVSESVNPIGSARIDEVAAHAKIAHNTFYSYFPSMKDAIDALIRSLAADFASTMYFQDFYRETLDPALRVAISFQFILLQAARNPLWAGALVRFDMLKDDRWPIPAYTKDDIKRGADCGAFSFKSFDGAFDLFVGTNREALQYIMRKGYNEKYIQSITEMMLLSFRFSPLLVANTVADARRLIAESHNAEDKWALTPPPAKEMKTSRLTRLGFRK